jgi:hypothetical protein
MPDLVAEEEYLVGQMSLLASELDLVRGRLASLHRDDDDGTRAAETEHLFGRLARISSDLAYLARGRLIQRHRGPAGNRPAEHPIPDRTVTHGMGTMDTLSAETLISRLPARRDMHKDMILELLRVSPGGLNRQKIIDCVRPHIQTKVKLWRKPVLDTLSRLTREGKIKKSNDMYFPI